jgi:hypothetical protein
MITWSWVNNVHNLTSSRFCFATSQFGSPANFDTTVRRLGIPLRRPSRIFPICRVQVTNARAAHFAFWTGCRNAGLDEVDMAGITRLPEPRGQFRQPGFPLACPRTIPFFFWTVLRFHRTRTLYRQRIRLTSVVTPPSFHILIATSQRYPEHPTRQAQRRQDHHRSGRS